MILNYTVKETIRIDNFLRRELPAKINSECSNSKIRRLILAGCVSVNGKEITRPAYELRGTSVVHVEFDGQKFFYEKKPDDIKFEVSQKDILFEDENLIFVNKPAFFPVEQTVTGNRDNLHDELVNFLWKRQGELRNPPYVGIMHRLDRETSGVILFTKNRQVNKAVSELFQNHDFTKKYFALVEKNADSKLKIGQTFCVEMTMGRISGKSQKGKWGKLSEESGGQYSKTDFKIIKETETEGIKCFLVECSLYTGRTHQIRVHLSSLGLPILGDSLYGGREASRLYLHAAQLSAHNKDFSFDVRAPLPF